MRYHHPDPSSLEFDPGPSMRRAAASLAAARAHTRDPDTAALLEQAEALVQRAHDRCKASAAVSAHP